MSNIIQCHRKHDEKDKVSFVSNNPAPDVSVQYTSDIKFAYNFNDLSKCKLVRDYILEFCTNVIILKG